MVQKRGTAGGGRQDQAAVSKDGARERGDTPRSGDVPVHGAQRKGKRSGWRRIATWW